MGDERPTRARAPQMKNWPPLRVAVAVGPALCGSEGAVEVRNSGACERRDLLPCLDDGMISDMGRDRTHQPTRDLFSTASSGETSRAGNKKADLFGAGAAASLAQGPAQRRQIPQ